MKKLFFKIYELELQLHNSLGTRFTYLLIFLSIIGCYSLGYIVGKLMF